MGWRFQETPAYMTMLLFRMMGHWIWVDAAGVDDPVRYISCRLSFCSMMGFVLAKRIKLFSCSISLCIYLEILSAGDVLTPISMRSMLQTHYTIMPEPPSHLLRGEPSISLARFSKASIINPATLSDTAALTAAYSGLANWYLMARWTSVDGVGLSASGCSDHRVTMLLKTAEAAGVPSTESPLRASTETPGTQRRRLVNSSLKPPQPTCRSARAGQRRPWESAGAHCVTREREQ